jgi:hypothetical protein
MEATATDVKVETPKAPKTSSLMGKYITFLSSAEAGTYAIEAITGKRTHNGNVFPALRKLGFDVKVVSFEPHTFKSKKTGEDVTVKNWHPIAIEFKLAK